MCPLLLNLFKPKVNTNTNSKHAPGDALDPLIYMFAFPLYCGDNSAMTCPALLEDYVKMSYYTSSSVQPEAESTRAV